MMHKAKVVVAGAGPAGLVTAILLAQARLDVMCVGHPARQDPRTVAIMDPALKLLSSIGVWPGDVQVHSSPLKRLHIIDDTGNMVSAPTLQFSADELQLEYFCWNVPLDILLPALRAVAQSVGVRLLETRTTAAVANSTCIIVQLESGESVTALVAVAADGAQSVLRQSAGIGVENWTFNQDALVTQFAHSAPHQNVSTEWHKRGGPFTTVPLPGNRSSLVWMDRPEKIDGLMALSPEALGKAIQLQNHGSLGLVTEVAEPRRFAMRGIKAMRFAGARTLLVGEAGHVFPPIGAQGLNMSLRDAAYAAELISEAVDPGSSNVLDAYDRLRRSDVGPRALAINVMNRSLLSDFMSPHVLRSAGLAAVAAFAPLRELVMQQGLAPSGQLPFAMR